MPKFAAIRTEVTVANELGSLGIEYIGECEDSYNTGCTENCTSCLDTKCVFHETNRDTDEYKELSRELRKRIASVE